MKKETSNFTPPTTAHERNSSIELLRIIAMVMIVSHHFVVHGENYEWNYSLSTVIPFLWNRCMFTGGKIGVDVFILISGFFLVNSKKSIYTNSKRALKIWGELIFYSVVIYFIFVLIGIKDFTIKSFVRTFFPITFSDWWFASTYFVLFLFHPFLNILIHSLDKRTYQILMALLLACWCIIPTFLNSQYQSNALLWFITLYIIAGYAKIYGFNPRFSCKHYFIFFWGVSILTYMLWNILSIAGKKWAALPSPHLYGQNNLPVLIISITLFMAFVTLKLRYHKWINVIASATFGVYLLHDNSLVRTILWHQVFNNAEYQNNIMFIPYSIAVVAIVYLICTMIDLLRQHTFEILYMKVVNHYLNMGLETIKKVNNYVKLVVFGG